MMMMIFFFLEKRDTTYTWRGAGRGGGGRKVAISRLAKGSDYRRPFPAQMAPGRQPRHRWVATPSSASSRRMAWAIAPHSLPSTGWGRARAYTVWESVQEEGEDALPTRYPPYPNGATARWLCLAEGPQCDRGRGAGWSSGPPLRFQSWQPVWGAWLGIQPRHRAGGASRALTGISTPPPHWKASENNRRTFVPGPAAALRKQERGGTRPPTSH